jgi:hypothetical protein
VAGLTATTFAPLGQAFLLALIQAGGLGIMTLTTFFAFAFSGGTLRQYASLQSLLGEQSLGHIRSTLAQIALVTLGFETAGAAVLYRHLPEGAVPESGRLFSAVFHSVSAFCNAGFALHGRNLAAPGLAENVPVQATVVVLVVAGGLGFPVLAALGLAGAGRGQELTEYLVTETVSFFNDYAGIALMVRDLHACEAKPKLSEKVCCMMEVYVNNIIVGMPLGAAVGGVFGVAGSTMLTGMSAANVVPNFGAKMGVCEVIDPSNLDDL